VGHFYVVNDDRLFGVKRPADFRLLAQVQFDLFVNFKASSDLDIRHAFIIDADNGQPKSSINSNILSTIR